MRMLLRALALVLLAAGLASCHCDPAAPAKASPLYCEPCSGVGDQIVIQTERPVPISAIVYWHLCFTQTTAETCWYDCPGPLEDTVFKGAEICKGAP